MLITCEHESMSTRTADDAETRGGCIVGDCWGRRVQEGVG